MVEPTLSELSGKTGVDFYWSGTYKRTYPLHKPELVEKAIRHANWRERVHHTVFLAAPPEFESEPAAAPGQRTWLCNALQALTLEEVISLYNSLIAGAKACNEVGGDFTPQIVRDQLPHIYEGSTEAGRAMLEGSE